MLHYSNIPIYKDPEWFPVALQKLSDMWDKVVYYREHPDEIKAEHEEYVRLKRLKGRRRSTRFNEEDKRVFYKDTTILPLEGLDPEKLTGDDYKAFCQFYYGHVKFGGSGFSDNY